MDESKCMVSVACLAYNHEATLAEALESFVSQRTAFPYEVLVNDDASTDGTAEVLREYAQRYPGLIRPFYQRENLFSQGKDPLLAALFPNARGKYIALCEGDDYWTDPTKLQRQVEFLESHTEYAACVHNTTVHFCGGEQADEPLRRVDGDCDVTLGEIIPGMNGAYHTSSLMAKAELLANPPDFYFTAYRYGFGDYPDALWLALNGPIRFLDREMSVYRVGSNASSWSAGIAGQYGKLRKFVIGKRELLKAFRPYAPEEYLALVDETIREREFELMYIEGRDREQRRPPYDEILRRQPFAYRLNNTLKSYLPHLHRLYRSLRGYKES